MSGATGGFGNERRRKAEAERPDGQQMGYPHATSAGIDGCAPALD